MNVFITGGTGFIGAKVAQLMADAGHRVTLFDTNKNDGRLKALGIMERESVRVELGDVSMLADLTAAVKRSGASVVIHLAAMLGRQCHDRLERATQANVIGSLNTLQAAVYAGAERVVLASSSSVYGSDDQYQRLPIREDAARLLVNANVIYGAGKLYTELLADQFRDKSGLQTVSLRPNTVYGPGRTGGSYTWIAECITKAFRGEAVVVPASDRPISLIYIEDIARQFIALAEAPASAIADTPAYNSGGDVTSVKELFDVVREIVPGGPIELQLDEGFPHAVDISDDLMRERIGYSRRFTPLRAGLEQYLEDLKAWS